MSDIVTDIQVGEVVSYKANDTLELHVVLEVIESHIPGYRIIEFDEFEKILNGLVTTHIDAEQFKYLGRLVYRPEVVKLESKYPIFFHIEPITHYSIRKQILSGR